MTVALPYHFDSSRVWRMILTGALAIEAVILAGALYGFLVRGDVALVLPLVPCGALLAYFIRISRISPEELKAKLDGGEQILIVDVRDRIDFETEPTIIPGALHPTIEDLDQRHQEIPREREIVVYCT
jgi:hypothetical protein